MQAGNVNCGLPSVGGFMGNAQILNLEPALPETPEARTEPVVDEFSQTQRMMEEARSDVQRIRRQVERQADEYERHEKRTKVLSIFLGLLILLFAGAAWVAYPTLANGRKTTADVNSLQGLSSALGQHLNALENTFKADLPALSVRMDKLQANMKTNLQVARSQAQAVATQTGKRLRDEMNQTLQAIESRLTGLESNQKESSDRVTRLQQQVVGLQQEIARMREEAAAAAKTNQELNQSQKDTASEPRGLSEPDRPAPQLN
jgi:septal ring factor EnvC (AmiA/AmiB activator)